MITQNPKVDRRDWNGHMTQKLGLGFGFTKKACFVCGSYSHLIKDCDFHEKRMANKSVLKDIGKVIGHREVRPVWNNTQRINHQNKFIPSAVLTRSGRLPVSAAKQSSFRAAASTGAVKQVNTATHKIEVNGVNIAGQTAVSVVKGNGVTAVKATAGCVWRPKMTDLNNVSKDNSGSWVSKSGNPQQALKNKGIFDIGCSMHMTWNKDFLTDYQDIDGGFVAFGRSARGGKITGKGKIRTDKLDFEDVFFVKELKFNLLSVSQMCDKKNDVLFTKTECLVLSPNFKLLNESQVLLRVPRLGHVNFKTVNKLMKGNLVRGLPSKIFDNDHTCVACQKEKQHKASCKAKLMSSISQPLQMLHMDLLGLTSVRSINHKTYCLVVTDDFSRFSWVFFLASKDETSGILKRFITEIENQLNHKVKVIRCDNGTEFKNREMNELCGLKGIKREFSVAKTPQQNRVAERKNKTLIEAARTMLADSLLPTVFWAEAVNTACYVLNRVLVTKPHNKTPYELIIGRPPSISFIRPFECSVTILNTLDPLGKFDGKAEEGFLVGYSVNSKAFRVFNSQTRKVEENLHVNFLENKPNVAGQGPNWLFDIDSLTNSMNYQPKNVDAGQSEEKNVSTEQYIMFPLWSYISSINKSSDETDEDDTADDTAGEKPVQKPASENQQTLMNVLDKFEAQCNRQNLSGKTTRASSTNSFNTISTLVNAAGAPRTSNDVGPSFVPHGGSFPDDPLMPDLEDTTKVQNTGIFGSAYDDDDDLDSYNSPYVDQVMGAKADFNNMEPSTVVSPIPSTRQEPIKIAQALDDESWVKAMQEELLQFKIQKVWTLVDLPYGKKAIGTKIEAIRLFLAYASFLNFLVYQMDVKSAFLYGTIEEEVYVSQPQGFVDPEFPEKVYKVEKALYRLHQVPRAWSMIGSLMYLTSSRPDIMLLVCACSRFQVQPKASHLNAVKMIFKYLKGRPKLGLWYPKDSPFILEAFSDSDYACASLDRKSTTRGCQFLGSRLISWQCKKHTVLVNSTTEAEYIAASHCCGQVLWIQNQMLDYGYNFMQTKIHVDSESAIYVVKNPVYHYKTKHIKIRHHFIRDSYEKKLIEMVKIHTDYNVADLLTKAFDVT
ncbi:putative ribonuclease H-like domain-containing protein, partial [Tanacetum coccineum]